MIEKSLAWRIYRPDQPERVSLIFGTIHLAISDDRISDYLAKAITPYDEVYTETELSDEGSAYLNRHIMIDRAVWHEHLDRRRYDKMRRIFQKTYQVDIEQYRFIRPLLVMSLFYQSPLFGLGRGEKLDQLIHRYALEQGKKVGGIESIYDQVKIMNQIPLSYDFDQMIKWSKHVTKVNQKLKKLIRYYLQQDIAALYRYSSRSLGSHRALLLHDRNQLMADRISEIHDRQPAFFSFGAGHLAGAQGVLALLKHNKYIVKSHNL